MLYVILYMHLNVTSQLLTQCIILGMRLNNCSNFNCRKQFQLSYLWAFVKAVVFSFGTLLPHFATCVSDFLIIMKAYGFCWNHMLLSVFFKSYAIVSFNM